jgi:leucyl aminopeptidase
LTLTNLRRTLEAMPSGFRLHQISARQVDTASRVRLKAFYAAKVKELVADLTRLGGGKSMAFSFAKQFLVVKFWVFA